MREQMGSVSPAARWLKPKLELLISKILKTLPNQLNLVLFLNSPIFIKNMQTATLYLLKLLVANAW